MFKLMLRFLDWLRGIFWQQEMEITILGLQQAGKTTFVNVLAKDLCFDTIPTIGFNMRQVSVGRTIVKIWDLGGERRFRGMWERYCRGVNAILYIVDAADREKLPESTWTLHDLLQRPQLKHVPVLVLGNKTDLSGAIERSELIDRMKLKYMEDREVCCYMISCKYKENIDTVLKWLIKHSKSPT